MKSMHGCNFSRVRYHRRDSRPLAVSLLGLESTADAPDPNRVLSATQAHEVALAGLDAKPLGNDKAAVELLDLITGSRPIHLLLCSTQTTYLTVLPA